MTEYVDHDIEDEHTKATYYQKDDLTTEMTLSANINYEKVLYKYGKILIKSSDESFLSKSRHETYEDGFPF